jgi:hypothetical protein
MSGTKQEPLVSSINTDIENLSSDKRDIIETVIEKKQSMFNYLFPDAISKATDEHYKKVIDQEFKDRLRKLQVISEHQIQGLTEMFNADLINLKSKLRSDSIDKISNEFHKTIVLINNLESNFIQLCQDHNQKIVNCKIDFLREKLEEAFEDRIGKYIAALSENLNYILKIQKEIIEQHK